MEAKRLDGYQTDALTRLSLDNLGACEQSPWFHVLAYESPHQGIGDTLASPAAALEVEQTLPDWMETHE